ncbi:MAG: hypothetical protein LUG62_10090 [Clostridiales bacterium]|nr:hypothetical protein [Clostridiales bacterium]
MSFTKTELFKTEEQFQRTYEEAMESELNAPPSVMEAYKALQKAFDVYLAEYDAHAFQWSYEAGYAAGFKAAMGEGGDHA